MRANRAAVIVIAILMLAVPVLTIDTSDAESPAAVPYGATEYTVTFDTNSGSQALIDVTSKVTVNQKISELPVPVWKGHTFAGWHTSVDKDERVSEDKVYDQDTTLYAHWTQPEDRYNTGGFLDFTNPAVIAMVAFIIVALVICILAILVSMSIRRRR